VELSHSFTVPASVEETWSAFQDIESVAGCFPGATVTEVDGDDFTGSCKVKLGPIALVYSGTGTFREKDESAHRFVVEAKGKDKRGNGTAGATVTATMAAGSEGETDVQVLTDLSITGKPAQFGRGVIQDVSDKLLQQFVTCLQSKVGSAESPSGDDASSAASSEDASTEGVATGPAVTQLEPSESGGSEGPDGAEGSGADIGEGGSVGARKAPATTYSGVTAGESGTATSGGGASGRGTPAPSRAPDEGDNALDLGATVLPILAKAYWRQLVAGAAALVVLSWLRGRRRSRRA